MYPRFFSKRALQTSVICGTTIIKLFSSVGYESHTVEGIPDNVSRPNIHDIKYVTCTEVHDILETISNNKAGDSYGLYTERYKLAGDLYCSLLAVCFNVMFVHGYFGTCYLESFT